MDYDSIQGEGGEAERDFLQAALDGNLESLGLAFADGGAPDIFIDFYSSWEFENQWGDILISKTYFLPQTDPLDGRMDTSLSACLEGKETLIPLEELSPPYTALSVAGINAGNAGYPLVMMAGIRVRYVEQNSGETRNSLRPRNWLW